MIQSWENLMTDELKDGQTIGFSSGKSNRDWHQLSSLITEWICWKFHDTGGPSDDSKGVRKHKLRNKKIYTSRVRFPTDILPF